MRSYPLENDCVALQLADRYPVGFDVAFALANMAADEPVIPVYRVERLVPRFIARMRRLLRTS
jgi:hypothetical protein